MGCTERCVLDRLCDWQRMENSWVLMGWSGVECFFVLSCSALSLLLVVLPPVAR
ncbi:hypothetical protein DL95DRAFT_382774, partial [Leptodontidium sp. 2 PMI_412]